MFKEQQFTKKEWEDLLILPLSVYQMICGKNGSFSKEEENSILEKYSNPDKEKEPLLRELLFDLNTSDQAMIRKKRLKVQESLSVIEAYLNRMRKILTKKLTTKQYHRFIYGLLMCFGNDLANAGGGGLPSSCKDKPVTKVTPEIMSILHLCDKFNLDSGAGKSLYDEL